MPETEAIAQDLMQYMRENLLAQGTALRADTPMTQAGIDSSALVELLLYAERRWGVELPDNELTPEHVATVEALAGSIAAHRNTTA